MTERAAAPARSLPLPLRGALAKATAVAAGVTAIALGGRVEIPLVPVPVSLQTYAVLTISGLVGSRLAVATAGAYLACAALGLPVLSGGAAGLARMTGPTGGYLLGFVVAAFVVGRAADRGWLLVPRAALAAMALGHVLLLATGAGWLAHLRGWSVAWEAGLLPFLPGAVLKSLLAAATVELVRRRNRGRV